MAYQETQTTGYGTRVGRSFRSIGTGILLFCAATALLWWNEGRAVKTDKMLNEAEKACVDMENPGKIDPTLDGELVCATAVATTEDSLADSQFGLGAKAISLRRTVEYFQWVEHSESHSEDKLGGKEVTTTTYTYRQEWTSRPVDSGQFHDPAYQGRNFTLTQLEEQEQWAEDVQFGAYKLPPSLIQSIRSKEPVVLALDDKLLESLDKSAREVYIRVKGLPAGTTPAVQNVAAAVQAPQAAPAAAAAADSTSLALADSAATVVPDTIPQENKRDLEYIHQIGNVLYYGRVATAPEVGDVRVTFEKVVPAKVTIIAQVNGNTFKAYKSKNGKRFQTLVMGKKDADEIFDDAHAANSSLLWVLRIVGILLVIAALKSIFGFLETLLKVVPFVANIIGWGVGVVCTVIGVVWSLIIIAIAWLFYRPLLGISLLVLAGALVWLFAFKGKDKLKAMAQKNSQQSIPEPAQPA